MFSFFKRRPVGSSRSEGRLPSEIDRSLKTGGRVSPKASVNRWQEPIPVPQAQDADWAMWEDSVSFQESQISEYGPTEPAPIVPTDAPDAPDAVAGDPFAAVHKHSG